MINMCRHLVRRRLRESLICFSSVFLVFGLKYHIRIRILMWYLIFFKYHMITPIQLCEAQIMVKINSNNCAALENTIHSITEPQISFPCRVEGSGFLLIDHPSLCLLNLRSDPTSEGLLYVWFILSIHYWPFAHQANVVQWLNSGPFL